MAYMIVLKRKANVGVSAVLIILTVLFKVRYVFFTRQLTQIPTNTLL